MNPVPQPSDLFSLDMLARPLNGYTVPEGSFDPTGAWDQTYKVYTTPLPQSQHETGTLRLVREADTAQGAVRLTVHYEKVAVLGAVQVTDAEFELAHDVLGTPRSWTWETRVLDSDRNVMAGSRVRKNARIRGDRLVVDTEGFGRREARLDAPPAVSWALFDAVQRLDPETAPRTFTLIDQSEQVKPEHSLRFHGRERLLLGAGKTAVFEPDALDQGTVYRSRHQVEGGDLTELTAFAQTGRGILPTVYWRSHSGHAVIVTAGIEAYVLDSVQPA